MINRRGYLIGASAALICAPAVVCARNLMTVRGVTLPLQRNYHGFVDRLWINQRYRSGELRGDALMQLVGEGRLKHVPSEQLACDFAEWGTEPLSMAARQERAAFDLPPSDGAKGKLGIADLKEGTDAAEEAFG